MISLFGFVMWLTLKDNPKQIFDMLKNADEKWLFAIFTFVVLIRFIVGWIIKKECNLSHPNYRFRQGVMNAFVAGFMNGITPGASGGQLGQIYIFRKQGVGVSSAASILWLDFIIYQSTMVFSVLLLILLRFRNFYFYHSQFFVVVILGFLVNASIILGLWALVKFPCFYRWLTTTGVSIGSKLHIIKNEEIIKSKLDRQLERFNYETDVLQNQKKLILKIATAHFVRLILYYAIPYLCAKALNIPVEFSTLIDIIALSSYVSMVNAFIPLPGSSGGTEATFLLMFGTIFQSNEVAPIMILWRVMSYYVDLFIGFIVFFYAKHFSVPVDDIHAESEGNK